MKKLFFALICIFSVLSLCANGISKEEIIKSALEDNTTFTALKQTLTTTQKEISLKQNSDAQKQAYQAIRQEVKQALQKALDSSKAYYEKYKNNDKIALEYTNGFKKDIEVFKQLQNQQIDKIIADYANANFDITKMTNLHAFCFSSDQVRLDFVYKGQNGQIVYMCSGRFSFHIISEKTNK